MARRIPKEIEVKLRVADLRALVRKLRGLGAVRAGRVHEMNTLYDTPLGRFRKRGLLLRLRIVRPSGGAGAATGVLTYKGPSLRLQDWEGIGRPPRYKIREEIEVAVPEPERVRAILEAVGLVPSFRYEKFRASYRLRGIPGVHLELDETPVGNFVELEGSPRAIDRAAATLGYGPRDYIARSYLALHLENCRRRGIKPRDMLFPRRKRKGKMAD